VAGAVLLVSCSTPTAINPTRNLDYPVDMAMACLEYTPSTNALVGQPMTACHMRNVLDPSITTNGQRTLGTFAFIINSGTSELAVADMDTGRLLDLTPEAPGYGQLPVGTNPQALAASDDGQWVVTANRNTCDFTMIDPTRLLARTFTTTPPAGDTNHSLKILTGSGAILNSAPGEIVLLPSALTSTPTLIATFPSCDMVATLQLSFDDGTGTRNGTAAITSAYYVRPDVPGSVEAVVGEPVCPADCSNDADSGFGADGGAGQDGAAPDGGNAASADGGIAGAPSLGRLQALALVPDGSTVYVAGLNDSAVTSFAVTSGVLSGPVRFQLAANPIGVNRLRLGVDPYGTFLDKRGRFLYAFTRDDSVRVVSIGGAAPVECDVNVIAPLDQKAAACHPVGGPLPHRPLVQGPGIRIPTFSNPDSPSPLPRDIAFADLQPIISPDTNISIDTNYHALSGVFGFLLASNGQVYPINIAPNGEDGTGPIPNSSCLPTGADPTTQVQLPITATHSFRETRSVGQCFASPLTMSITPQSLVLVSDQAFATTANYSSQGGPLLNSFITGSHDANSVSIQVTNWLDYPDPDSIVSRAWNVIWEGALPQATRESGLVKADSTSAGARLDDSGADFCASGVQVGDVLMFSGCTQDSDCQPDDQFSCQAPVSGARGMCLPIDATQSSTLVQACARFVGSRMRYEVVKSTPTSLSLGLLLDEVPKTALNPCRTNADCQPDVDHGLLAFPAPDGGIGRQFECFAIHDNDPRCVKRCVVDSDCRAGNMCETVPGVKPELGKLCVEAPILDNLNCFPRPMTSYSSQAMTRYSVRAGKSFVVSGSSLPTLPSMAASSDGTCQPIVGLDPSLVSRIPLSAPECPPIFLGQAGNSATPFVQNLSAQAGSNPCLYVGSYPDGDAASTNGGASSDGGASPVSQPVHAFFQNPQIRFVMTNLDQYAGDLLGIHFEIQYGYIPMVISIPSYEVQLTLGTRILTGPTQTPESPVRVWPTATPTLTYPYFYVVDQGRTALTPASHGQVLRMNPREGSNEIATFDTAISGNTPFQLQ
jgi:hypothetical protein